MKIKCYNEPMANKDKYRKQLFRVVSILNKLDSGKVISSSELAEEFEVSLRTIQRDLDLLSNTGFPLSSSERGLYTFVEGFSLKKANLTGEEASLLSFLFDMTKSLGKDFEKSCGGIIKKVIQQEYETPFYAKLPQGPMKKLESPFIKTLEDAVCDCHKITIAYDASGKVKKYDLCPLKIIFYDGFWYLLAQRYGKEYVLKVRIEKIKDVEVQDESFAPPENLQTMLDESVNIWFNEFKPSKVLLRINKEVAHFFKQRIYFPKQKIKKENKDGSLLVESKIGDFREVTSTIAYGLTARALFHRGERDSRLFGAAVVLPTPLDEFAHLVAHFVQGRHTAADRRHVADFGRVARRAALHPKAVAEHLDRLGLARAARYVASSTTGDGGEFLEAVVRALPRDRLGAILADVCRAGLSRHPGSTPLGAIFPPLLARSLPRGAAVLTVHAASAVERRGGSALRGRRAPRP